MFGLINIRGSCWVNACLQALFRIPEVQERYTNDKYDDSNLFDLCLHNIWKSDGREGLKDFHKLIYSPDLPAGHGTGDSHELFLFLCDKLPFLDKLVRFNVIENVKCNSCTYTNKLKDSYVDYALSTASENTLASFMQETCKETNFEDFKCENKCVDGGKKQLLIGSFPKVLVFKLPIPAINIEYGSVLHINKNTYALLSIVRYNGSHWWAYGRDMPIGSNWYSYDDTSVANHGNEKYPLTSNLRMLIYYRLD